MPDRLTFGRSGERVCAITISLTQEQHDYLDQLATEFNTRKSTFCYEMVRDALIEQGFGEGFGDK